MRAGRLEPVQRLYGGVRSRLSAFDHKQSRSRRGREKRRVGEPQRRRTVDHDQIEPVFRLVDDLADPPGGEQVRRIGR